MSTDARPLRTAYLRWRAARRIVAAANTMADPAARSFAIRTLNKRRAHYRRVLAAAERWLATRREAGTNIASSPHHGGHQRAV
ncbi:hypothetical protein J2T57_002639 [Natronocella acetinitrilica]|uniref:Uncharacterized protein n=1 Tax=Natronocella acetinitrilica TaxID=414046 RepID=A0AAE3G4H9_9GAMM|nr:hypothetical protein [Natronocella acetinitrilica]MCP1675489.1 hypothetical protein [Natronocella acetinitrilica]